ncbi:MAG TPA: FCD domain-containing protein [Actinomycetota bacterium]|nr:FCD domain-containing protein [Actinomycetota bacterium]
MSFRFPAVEADTLATRVARELVRSILLERFSPGDQLPTEETLCRQFGVSRPVLREAIRTVAALGLVHSRQGRGTVVLPREEWNEFAPELLEARRELNLGDEFLLELLEMRRIVEVEAAALAAERAGEEDLRAMASHLEEMDRVGEDLDAFAELDVAFHDRILMASRNRPLLHLLRLVQPTLLAARRLSVSRRPQGVRRSAREHRRIYEAIAASSASRARAAMARHLSWTANITAADARRR